MRFFILLCFALSTLSAAETKLPADAAKAVERFDADAAKLRADAEKAVDVKAAALVKELQRVQDAAMKRGDLDGANAIKAAIEKLAPKDDKPKDVDPKIIKKRLAGKFNFTLPNGHSGPLEVLGSDATDIPSGIHGDVRIVDDAVTIFWGNSTQWHVIVKDDVLTLQTSEGCAPLILVETKKH